MRKLRWRQGIWLSQIIDFLCMMLSMLERPGGLTASVKNRQACASLASYTIFQFIISRTVETCKLLAGMSPAVLKDLFWWGFFFTGPKMLTFHHEQNVPVQLSVTKSLQQVWYWDIKKQFSQSPLLQGAVQTLMMCIVSSLAWLLRGVR